MNFGLRRWAIPAVIMLLGSTGIALGDLCGGASPIDTALCAADVQRRNLKSRMQDLNRSRTRRISLDHLTVETKKEALPGSGLAGFLPDLEGTALDRIGGFVAGTAGLVGNKGEGGTGLRSSGLTAGVETAFGNTATLGFAAGFMHRTDGEDRRATGGTIALYGAFAEDGWSYDAALGFGRVRETHADTSASHHSGVGKATALFATAGAAFEWRPSERVTLKPSLRLDLAGAGTTADGPSATHPAPDAQDDRLAGILTAGFGVDLHYRLDRPWGSVTPFVGIRYRQTVEASRGTDRTEVGAAPMRRSGSPSIKMRRPATRIDLGATLTHRGGASLTLGHSSERRTDGTRNHSLTADLRVTF